MNDKPVFYTQIVGLFVILLAMFGIDVSAEDQANIIAGLSSFGLVLTVVVDRWEKHRARKKQHTILD